MSNPEQLVEFSPVHPIDTVRALDLQRNYDLSYFAIESLSVYVLCFQSSEIREHVLISSEEQLKPSPDTWEDRESEARSSWIKGLYMDQAKHWKSRGITAESDGIKWLFASSLMLARQKVLETIGSESPIVVPPSYLHKYPTLLSDITEYMEPS